MSDEGPFWGKGELPTDVQIDAWITMRIEQIPVLRERYNAVVFNQTIRSGSMADVDGRSPFGKFVRTHGMNALGVADEVLATWREIYQAGIRPISAFASILRTVLETTTMARWLFDPKQASSERIRRGLLAHLEDLDERAKFEKAVPAQFIDIQPPSLPGADGLRQLLAEARAQGLSVVDERGRRKPTLSHVERCAAYAEAPGYGGEAAYRFVSSLAHGMHWSLAGVRHEPVLEVAAPFDAIVSHVTPNPDTIALVTSWGLDTFEAAVSDAEGYMGLPQVSTGPGRRSPAVE